MKPPPEQYHDDPTHDRVEAYIAIDGRKAGSRAAVVGDASGTGQVG